MAGQHPSTVARWEWTPRRFAAIVEGVSEELEFHQRLAALERRFLRPDRVDLEELARDLGPARTGPERWQHAIAKRRIPTSWAADPARRFRVSRGELIADHQLIGSVETAPNPGGGPSSLSPTPATAYAALLFASDPRGMLEAEARAREVVAAFAPWGAPQPRRIAWRLAGNPVDRPEAGGPPLGRLARPVERLREILDGSGRLYEPPHEHLRFRPVVDVLSWSRRWPRLRDYVIPRRAAGQQLDDEVFASLAGRRLGELPDPITAWLALWSTGYWLWSLGEHTIELAAPWPPPSGARPDKQPGRKWELVEPPLLEQPAYLGEWRRTLKSVSAPRALWSQRLSDLRLACARGEPGWVRRMLPLVEVAEDEPEPDQPRLLHFAAYGGPEVLDALAEHAAERRRSLELDVRDRLGHTPAMLAAGLPSRGPAGASEAELAVPISPIVGAAALDWLLNHGARIDATDLRGWTALHWAANEGRLACLVRLIARGAPLDARDHVGRTAMMLAVGNPAAPELIEALLRAGADPDARDERGWTALHYLAVHLSNGANRAQRNLGRLLSTAGARPSRDRYGRSPADIVALYERPHRDGGPLDLRTPVAAGPGPWPSFERAPELERHVLASVIDEEGRDAAIDPARPNAAVAEAWLVWADWLQSRGDPRGELVATSISAARSRKPQRRALQVELEHAYLRAQARVEASMLAGDPVAALRGTPTISLTRTHGFVTLARVPATEHRHVFAGDTGVERIVAAVEGLVEHEPALVELHLGVAHANQWLPLHERLLALAARGRVAASVRRLALHGLPREVAPLDELASVFPSVRELRLIGEGKLRSLELAWPSLRTLQLRHGDTSEWTRGGVELNLDLPQLVRLDLALPISGRGDDDEPTGFARTLAQLEPTLVELRVGPLPHRFAPALLDSPVFDRLQVLELDRVSGRALELLAAQAERLAGRRVRVSVVHAVARQREVELDLMRTRIPGLVVEGHPGRHPLQPSHGSSPPPNPRR